MQVRFTKVFMVVAHNPMTQEIHLSRCVRSDHGRTVGRIRTGERIDKIASLEPNTLLPLGEQEVEEQGDKSNYRSGLSFPSSLSLSKAPWPISCSGQLPSHSARAHKSIQAPFPRDRQQPAKRAVWSRSQNWKITQLLTNQFIPHSPSGRPTGTLRVAGKCCSLASPPPHAILRPLLPPRLPRRRPPTFHLPRPRGPARRTGPPSPWPPATKPPPAPNPRTHASSGPGLTAGAKAAR